MSNQSKVRERLAKGKNFYIVFVSIMFFILLFFCSKDNEAMMKVERNEMGRNKIGYSNAYRSTEGAVKKGSDARHRRMSTEASSSDVAQAKEEKTQTMDVFQKSYERLIWEKKSKGIDEDEIISISISKDKDPDLYVGSKKAVYKFNKNHDEFQVIFRPTTNSPSINEVYLSPLDNQRIYIATDDGLYLKDVKGVQGYLIFSSSEAGSCLSVMEDDSIIYLGTQNGLYVKKIGESTWKKGMQSLNAQGIYQIISDDKFIYFSAACKVFSMNKQTFVYQEIFTLKGSGCRKSERSDDWESKDEKKIRHMVSFRLENNEMELDGAGKRNSLLLLAALEGIFFSLDYGKRWERLLTKNIPLEDSTSMILSKRKNSPYQVLKKEGMNTLFSGTDLIIPLDLIVGTKKGAFFYLGNGWVSIYKGMETETIHSLANDSRGRVYAAGNRGFFCLSEFKPFAGNSQPVEALNRISVDDKKEAEEKRQCMDMAMEPSIRQVHRWAIDYAEVSNNKIKKWRKLAQRRAWFPKLSMGLDGTKNKTISDSVWGSYSSGGQEHIGPDDKTFYDNFGWDVSLSWDFADLIYSGEQTSIDSRSKLMVELREDIVDKVTRLYFERRRIQMELILEGTVEQCPDAAHRQMNTDASTLDTLQESEEKMSQMGVSQQPLDKNLEKYAQVQKMLRVAELTALIDSMVGGKFSSEVIHQ